MELLKHQAEHVPWLLARPRAMLGWEMGVGKTAPLIRAWETTREHGPMLIVCTATARQNWKREIERFALDPLRPPKMAIFRDRHMLPPRDADVVIVNYEKLLMSQYMVELRQYWGRWGAIVFDEAHRLKTPHAKTTRIAYGPATKWPPLIDHAERVWLATGTPMPAHPGELYSHARALWPERCQYNGHVMEQWEWEAAFCEMRMGDYGMKVVGGKNFNELKARLSPVISVIKRAEVLDLPLCTIDVWPLDSGDTKSRVPEIPGLLGTLETRYGKMRDIDRFDTATLSAYLACIETAMQPLASLRRETAQLKAVYVALTLLDGLEFDADLCIKSNQAPHKIIVFAIHREAIETLQKGLAKFKPAVVHGDVPETKRQSEIDRFVSDPQCRIFIGQLTAAGSSINLQVANDVIFVEASWTPGENDQALSRAYRYGQQRPVRVRFAYLPDSIDEAVMRANKRKLEMISQVFG